MPFTLTMPKLSPTMDEGTIVKWHKHEGDFVKSGELLIEVATDKATVEHNALDEGWLRKIIAPEGSTAQINQSIAIFTEQKDESIADYQPEGILLQTESKATIATPQAKDEMVKETEKVSSAGSIKQPSFVPEPPLTNFTFSEQSIEERVFASPLAKRLAKDKNLDLTTVHGSGPHGRISSRDLAKAQANAAISFGREQMPRINPGSYIEKPLSPIRKAIARRLQESKSFIPHFYVRQTIDADALFSLREQLKNLDVKVSFNDMIVRACALALRKHPEINIGYNSVSQSIIAFQTIDIAIAVSISDGLITPIIRHANYKNLGEIAVEVRYLANRAREGKLTEQEYKGGSFTISNLGMFGISDFGAIINPPQAAILAIGAIEEKPVIKNNTIVIGKTLSLTLSVDHRVIDGEPAAQFLKTLKHYLENPTALIM